MASLDDRLGKGFVSARHAPHVGLHFMGLVKQALKDRKNFFNGAFSATWCLHGLSP